jgi:hypothetical protein
MARRVIAGIRLLTRNGHDVVDRYPTVATAVGQLKCWSCTIDGEVAILDERGRACFERLQQGSRVKPEAILYAFDLLELDGCDLRQEPLVTRNARYRVLRLAYLPASCLTSIWVVTAWPSFAMPVGSAARVSSPSARNRPINQDGSRDWIKTKTPAAIRVQKLRSENWV